LLSRSNNNVFHLRELKGLLYFVFLRIDAWSLPALGSAHNSLAVGEMLEKIIKVAQSGKMREADVDVDDQEEYIHELKTLRESYTKY